MLLDSNNFVINMIIIDGNEVKTYDITNKIYRFTNSNSAPTLGQENMKYKIMFQDLEFEKVKNTINPSIIIQLAIKVGDRFYNPYLFLPISQHDTNNSQEGPGRAISYQLFDNKFSHLWLYLTHKGVDDIIEKFPVGDNITNTFEYIKEYLPNTSFTVN